MTRLVLQLFLLLSLVNPALAQQSEMFGPYELHYSVVNTTFLEPQVAATYGIVRGDQRAILNLAVREHLDDGSQVARTMELRGVIRDLIQKEQSLQFQQVREGPAIYYLADFKFLNEEWLSFAVDFRPEGADRTYSFELKQQLYADQ